MKPVFEIRLVPKDANAAVVHIDVLVDSVYITDRDKCLDFIEKQFPFYNVETVLQGYKDA